MKKKVMSLLLTLVLILSLSGCGVKMSIVVKEDGTSDITMRMDMEADQIDAMLKQTGGDASELTKEGYKLVEVDGKRYYRYEETINGGIDEIVGSEYDQLTKDHIRLLHDDMKSALDEQTEGVDTEEYGDLLDQMEYTLSVTLPKKVDVTNGKVSSDKKTITWDLLKTQKVIYAYVSGYKDTKKPSISGVKDGKTYSAAVKVKYSDNTVVKSATLDGKKLTSGKKVTAKGSHTVVVTDVFGNQRTVKFTIK